QLATLEQIADLEELPVYYEQALEDLQLTSTNTLYHQNRLTRAYEQHRHRLLEQICQQAALGMRRAPDFGPLMDIYDATMARAKEMGLTSEQKLLVEDSLELNLERIRNRRLGRIYEQVDSARSAADLDGLWEQVKNTLSREREFFGQNLARIIAQKFDARAAALSEAEASAEAAREWDEVDDQDL
ncbi:MAG: hypothetical protein KJ621_00005, partial [Proteobacteria bacterium]|nr:hypothetical protein [Pseudomonadota bacterium]